MTLDFDRGRSRRRDVCGDARLQLHAVVLAHAEQVSTNLRKYSDVWTKFKIENDARRIVPTNCRFIFYQIMTSVDFLRFIKGLITLLF